MDFWADLNGELLALLLGVPLEDRPLEHLQRRPNLLEGMPLQRQVELEAPEY